MYNEVASDMHNQYFDSPRKISRRQKLMRMVDQMSFKRTKFNVAVEDADWGPYMSHHIQSLVVAPLGREVKAPRTMKFEQCSSTASSFS